jgi:hypothetical protein
MFLRPTRCNLADLFATLTQAVAIVFRPPVQKLQHAHPLNSEQIRKFRQGVVLLSTRNTENLHPERRLI